MIQNDRRRTNATVDDILVARKLVAQELELNVLHAFVNVLSPRATIGHITADAVQTGTLSASAISAGAINVTELKVTGDSKATNVLFVPDPSTVVSGTLAQFTNDAKTQITPIAISSISGSALNYLFLDGSDGNVTISTPVTLTRDYYYDTLTIDAGGVLDPGGWVIYCKTALINNGVIRSTGGNGGNAAGAVGGAPGAAIVSTGEMYGTTANGGGNTTTDGGSSTGTFITTIGGVGGVGGNSNTNVGGTSSLDVGFFNKETVVKSINFFGLLQGNQQLGGLGGLPGMGGGGGAGGTVDGGGGSGAGGGWIAIVAKTISGSGTFEAKGGDGGAGGLTDGGGGGGGGGGVVYFIAQTNAIVSSQVFVTGGTGGAGGFQAGVAGNVGVYQVNLI